MDDIEAGNAAQSDYYKSLTDRGIDPFAPAGPDRDLDCDECYPENHVGCTPKSGRHHRCEEHR